MSMSWKTTPFSLELFSLAYWPAKGHASLLIEAVSSVIIAQSYENRGNWNILSNRLSNQDCCTQYFITFDIPHCHLSESLLFAKQAWAPVKAQAVIW